MNHDVAIIHLNLLSSFGGGERQLVYTVQALQKSLPQLIGAQKASGLADFCNTQHLPYFTFNKRSSLSPTNINQLRSKLAKRTILHAHDSRALNLALATYLTSRHRPLIVASRKVMFPLKGLLSRKKYNHPAIKQIICVSDAVKSEMTKYIHTVEKLVTVYDGINLQHFQSVTRKDLRKTLNINDDCFLIGSIAALTPIKNHFTLIRAVALLRQRQIPAKAIIIGNGPMLQPLKNTAQQLNVSDHIVFLPATDNIVELLPNFSAYTLTSTAEALGSSILAAMAAKVPVVASQTGGIPEIVKDGVTGLLAPPEDPEAFAAAFTKLWQNHSFATALSNQAMEFIQSFSVKELGARTLAIYHHM